MRNYNKERVNIDIFGELAVRVREYCKNNGIEYRYYIRDLVKNDIKSKMKERKKQSE